MKIPWLRRNFLARRWLDRIFLDAPDYALRTATGRLILCARSWAEGVLEPARYGVQDLLLLERPRQSSDSF